MEHNPLLGPVIGLVVWTLVMFVWMAITRFPLMKGGPIPDGARGSDIPAGKHNWPAHNYVHLHEQPTLFYAIVLALVALDDRADLNLWLAWAYVVLRIAHSIWQSSVNKVPIRFQLFLLSTLCLLVLTIHAAMRFIHG